MPPQDVIFVVDEVPHARFRREGANLFTTCDINLLDALADTKHVIQGLDGNNIVVDVGSDLAGGIIRPGDVSRVVGMGMPVRRNSQVVGAGDLIIKYVSDHCAPKYLCNFLTSPSTLDGTLSIPISCPSTSVVSFAWREKRILMVAPRHQPPQCNLLPVTHRHFHHISAPLIRGAGSPFKILELYHLITRARFVALSSLACFYFNVVLFLHWTIAHVILYHVFLHSLNLTSFLTSLSDSLVALTILA